MDIRRSFAWTAAGLGTLAGALGLALALGQWHVRSLDEQGGALVAAGQYLAAVRVLLEAVAEAPGDARAHYDLGLAYAGIGLCGAAWLHLEEAVRLAPAYRRVRRSLGTGCRGGAARADVAGFDTAVRQDRQGGASQ
jgi:tetratricopeptide (TPR) repeat protein